MFFVVVVVVVVFFFFFFLFFFFFGGGEIEKNMREKTEKQEILGLGGRKWHTKLTRQTYIGRERGTLTEVRHRNK